MKYEKPKVIDLSEQPSTGYGHDPSLDCNPGSTNNYDCASQGYSAGMTCGTGNAAGQYCYPQGIGGNQYD